MLAPREKKLRRLTFLVLRLTLVEGGFLDHAVHRGRRCGDRSHRSSSDRLLGGMLLSFVEELRLLEKGSAKDIYE